MKEFKAQNFLDKLIFINGKKVDIQKYQQMKK